MPGAAGAPGNSTGAGAAGAQPNPFAAGAQPNPFAGMGGMGGMNPLLMQQMMGGGGFGAAPVDSRPPREKYATQLTQIKEMGFIDEEVIL